MSSIKAIASAPGDPQAAAYAGKASDEDILAPVLAWTVIKFDGDEPDEVVGQIFDGQCITEASSVDEEEGFGEFVGYFALTKEGKQQAKQACDAFREAKAGKKKGKKKKEPAEEEPEDDFEEEPEDELEDEEESDDEDDDEFGGFLDEEDDEGDDEEGD